MKVIMQIRKANKLLIQIYCNRRCHFRETLEEEIIKLDDICQPNLVSLILT